MSQIALAAPDALVAPDLVIPSTVLATPRTIPLTRLVPSGANVRKIKAGISVDELAEDIARRGLLQSISVRPLLDDQGFETGDYAVFAGGRRLAAIRKLAAEGRLPADVLVPCIIKSGGLETEDSLAENVMREGLHPLDQFRAFRTLSEEQGLSVEEIAARFFVSPQVVRQRLKLASASLVLLAEYADDGMTLEQLMAFCVTNDHARQEAVWEQIRHGHNKEPYFIRRLLTEGAVKGNDKRVLFVGAEAYEAAGGLILRDLFAQDASGWFQDAALLDRLATEKLAEHERIIAAEGWKWVESALQFPFGHLNGLMKLTPEAVPISDEDQARYDAALDEYNTLSEEYQDAEELPEAIDQRLGELEAELARVDERPAVYPASEMACAGVFISIEHDGRLRVERGFVRAEDRVLLRAQLADGDRPVEASRGPALPHQSVVAGEAGDAGEEVETASRLSDRLVAELTAYRTLALREKMAEDPDTALLAMTHVMALKTFYRFSGADSCLEIDLRSAALASHSTDLSEASLATRMDARHARWVELLPKSSGSLWEALVAFDPDSLAALFAYCASTSINALDLPHIRQTRELAHADALARHVALDMRPHWQPTAKAYFSEVTKAEILATVREVKGEAAAQMLDHLKKSEMAIEAERLLMGSAWLPSVLQGDFAEKAAAPGPAPESAAPMSSDGEPSYSEPEQVSAVDDEALPAFLMEAAAMQPAFGVAAE